MPPLYLTSPLLSVVHGFSLRSGGVSAAPFSSLNLGFHVGDAPQSVTENLARLEAAAGIAPGALHTVTQVHGDRVLEAPESRRRKTDAREGASDLGQADALISRHPGVAVGVRTADCVPLLIQAPSGEVAAVHAGWRGVESEIVLRAIEQLAAPASRLRVAIGPAIGVCCYEVSAELAGRFAERFGAGVVRSAGGEGGPRLDLIAALKVTLATAGVPDAQVDVLGVCTACDELRCFSHRRDRGATGRHLSFIQCEQRPNS